MRTIKRNPIREYFREPILEHINQFTKYPLLLAKKYLLNKFVLLSGLTALSLILGLFERNILVVAIPLLALLGLLYLEARGLARAIFIARTRVPAQATEMDLIEIQLDIINAGSAALRHCIIQDHFGPGLDSNWQGSLPEPLPPKTRRMISYQRVCDGGMGTFSIGPLEVRVRDSLGVFEFTVTLEQTHTIQVLPKVDTIPQIPIHGFSQSDQYGLYENSAKGQSVNFIGIRDYQPGDSLRHIAWKLTAKRQKIMVKEFEVSINAFVSVFLNLHSRIHLGTKSLSTWELARDVSLSIIHQQLGLGNTVQFFTNELFVEPGRGAFHLEYVAKRLLKLPLADHPILNPLATSSVEHLIDFYKESVPPGSTVFYVAPFIPEDLELALPQLRQLVSQGTQVFCVLIDITSLYSELISRVDVYSLPRVIFERAANPLNQVVTNLKIIGISTYVIRHGEPLGTPFAKAEASK